jgi:DNA-binding XRE family transcriptional regulator
MSDIERGRKNPSMKIIQAIADVHAIKLSKLFAMVEKMEERSHRH